MTLKMSLEVLHLSWDFGLQQTKDLPSTSHPHPREKAFPMSAPWPGLSSKLVHWWHLLFYKKEEKAHLFPFDVPSLHSGAFIIRAILLNLLNK